MKKNLSTKLRLTQNAVLMDTVKSRLTDAATSTVPEILSRLGSRLTGLSENEVRQQRSQFGKNAITKGKKKSLGRRIAEAFINPFTAILIGLALVSAATDMIFPAFSMLGNTPEDFDPLTVIIILTMVLLSGTLRFVQKSRSGNAAEKLLAMITTTCTVTRRNKPKMELPLDEVVPGDIILLEKDLMVLEEGIVEGRKTYANMIKYIKMTASSNFGNMLSVLAASALLPFLPMMSVHLIFLNLIYDLSCTAIPWDNVDEEFLTIPRKWNASSVGNFMIWQIILLEANLK